MLFGVASDLATKVNALHVGGGGAAFFTLGADASTLQVNVTAATMRPGSTGAAGANDVALAIAALRGGSVNQSYTTLVSRVGEDVRSAKRQEANLRVLLDAVNDRRDGVSGVSMDEEMSNLVRFQRGYQANARAMSTMDEMLDQLINRTGRVGL